MQQSLTYEIQWRLASGGSGGIDHRLPKQVTAGSEAEAIDLAGQQAIAAGVPEGKFVCTARALVTAGGQH